MNATTHTPNSNTAQAMGIAAGMHTLAGHLGTCPTCLASPATVVDEYTASVAEATCPTCGHTSVEYGMVVEMDAILARLNGLDALAAALDALD